MIRINFESDIPIYIQLKNGIIKEIAKGVLNNGDTLPSIRALSSDLEVNLHTVNKAYNLLKDEGYVTIDRRRGAVIWIDTTNSEKFKNEIYESIEEVIYKCICKDIPKDDVIQMIEDIYSKNIK